MTRWIGDKDLANLADISRRHASRCMARGYLGPEFNGHRIRTKKLPGRARGGKALWVEVASLPDLLRDRALARRPAPAELPAPTPKPRKPTSKTGTATPWPKPSIRTQIDLPAELLATFDAILRAKGMSIRVTGASQRETARKLSLDAYDLCRDAGSQLPKAKLQQLTKITRAFVSHLRPGRYMPAYLNDAKSFHDRDPGPPRDWNLLSSPLALLVSDVSPLDIRFVLPGGRELKLRLIASVDGKTRRLFGHVYVPAKGEGVRQEHVAAHLVWVWLEVGICDDWYIDRGGEMAIDDMAAAFCTVHKSLPYNARAKLIEPIFAVLLRFIAEIPGFIGSDRMRKKTQSVGKPAEPFPGTLADLVRAVQDAIAHYNATPMPALGDLAPDQVWQAEVNAGFRPRKADQATLAETFCRRIVRTVTRGAVKIDGLSFTAEELWRRADLEGEKVTVAVSLFGFPPAVFDRTGAFVCLLQEDRAYHPLDPAGAVESARRKRVRSQGARAFLSAHPPADLADYRRRYLGQHAPVQEPPAGELVELPAERAKAAEARRHAGALPAPEAPSEHPSHARRRRMAGLPTRAVANE